LIGSAQADADGNWSFAPALADGAHLITAVALTNGAPGPPSGLWEITVDDSPPAPPVIESLIDRRLPVVGLVARGAEMNDPTPVLTGSGAPAGGVVDIYDNGSLIGIATADAAGNWAFNISQTLADGSHSLSVTAISAAGIEGGYSAPFDFVLDTVPPDAPVFSVGPDTGLSATDGVTNAPVQTLTGAPGVVQPDALITVYDGNTVLGTATTGADGAWSLTTAALTDGAHYLMATASNAAGNISESSAVSRITVDTVAPVLGLAAATVNTYLPDDQTAPQSANLTGGGYVTVWTSGGQDGSGLGVYMQRLRYAAGR
jgi:hypothetical protein